MKKKNWMLTFADLPFVIMSIDVGPITASLVVIVQVCGKLK